MKEVTDVERCPHCNCRDIGKIGNNQFYCWNCFMEFALVGDEVKIYHVDEDGSLVAWNPEPPMEDTPAAV
ncbi:hypothetical protein [Ferroacidibacillus organovorans]|uniref:Uncharacterized protein n=1 Tax=Ferroacidibacillus organovorans TaxID=1765683 RepID=A0A162T8M6_9BACL|nr:hypothetical protein [Ferroacidibacillus organovorans]KYP80568.1 hypothetical protein AYJ22_10915 [Ferroacidibacillus organovorans]OAG93463.1 hypothetical protein AYW79_10555 [Ferroacidibacillus organovorans]OPG17068.1 hypothetical protein B2M26_03470 [Ferroacidibacillus organovorans]